MFFFCWTLAEDFERGAAVAEDFTTAEKASELGTMICVIENKAKRLAAASRKPIPPDIVRRIAALKAIARDVNRQLKAEKEKSDG